MHSCTIITANFLAFARTLVASYREHNRGGKFFVLFLDHPPKDFDLSGENFEVLFAEDIGVPDLEAMRMRYSAYELSMALRPWFVLYLLREKSCETLLFLDADLFVTGSMHKAGELLEHYDVLLTPSVLAPIPDDGCIPSDREILSAGTFNGGFLGIKNTEASREMLQWLAARLEKGAYHRPEEGLFGDQKWLDFLPSILERCCVLRDPAWNVAHWNLHERSVVEEGGLYTVLGEPMTFYHFSGFRYESPRVLSIHQDRFTLHGLPAIQKLHDEYRRRLAGNGIEETRLWRYAFDSFENGVKITPPVRRVYECASETEQFTRPFDTGEGSFYAWLLEEKSGINNLQTTLHRLCPEAHLQFPELGTRDRDGFFHWLLRERKRELPLSPIFTENAIQMPLAKISMKKMLRLRHTNRLYQHCCRALKRIIGRRLYRALQPKPDPAFPPVLRWMKGSERCEPGVTMIGSLGGESGVSHGLRSHLRALQQAGVPCSGIDSKTSPGRQHSATSEKEKRYRSTIVECGMDELSLVLDRYTFPCTANAKRIGFITWEVASIPSRFLGMLEQFDELWTPSTFTTEILSQHLHVPVLTMGYAVDVSERKIGKREYFGIPANAFAFLFVFDFFSHMERKNPLATIDAFRQAFEGRDDVCLVLAVSHGKEYPEDLLVLKHAIGNAKNIVLLENYMDHATVLALMETCDAYISLHRTESFGLTIGEAMALGKPVIATDFGGSTDFLRAATGYPVTRSLIQLQKTVGPYPAGALWAEPNITDAAEAMKIVAAGGENVQAKARAAAEVMQQYSLQAIGEKMKRRLETIGTV